MEKLGRKAGASHARHGKWGQSKARWTPHRAIKVPLWGLSGSKRIKEDQSGKGEPNQILIVSLRTLALATIQQ
jgi:hypothetical protein